MFKLLNARVFKQTVLQPKLLKLPKRYFNAKRFKQTNVEAHTHTHTHPHTYTQV